MLNIFEDDFTNSNFFNCNWLKTGKLAIAIRKVFNYYCHLQNKEYKLPYDDGYIDSIHIDKNWIKVQGMYPKMYNGGYRYNLPQPYRNEMNIPTNWLLKENWKELIEQQIKRDKNEYLIKKLSE